MYITGLIDRSSLLGGIIHSFPANTYLGIQWKILMWFPGVIIDMFPGLHPPGISRECLKNESMGYEKQLGLLAANGKVASFGV